MRRPRRPLAAAATALGLAVLAAPAHAADPIMPLDQVREGMRCTGLSVVRGTAIDRFDVEVLDIVRGEEVAANARILVRVSGPAIDETGLGPGFSGSPVMCRDDEGVLRNAGAISETVGEYGGEIGLVTPIEQVLGEPVDVPQGAPPAPADRRALAAPLSVAGLSEPVAQALRRAGRARGRLITTAPAAPGPSFPPQQLVPGAAMAAGLAAGDVNAGSIGTVTYVDGDRLWAFGHQIDGTGRRGLLLQDAYVYTVVSNPNATQDAITYKLAAAGHQLGTMTNDAPDAVAGRLGALPRTFPLQVSTRDLDTGRTDVLHSTVSDERPLGEPGGVSALATVGPVAVAQAAFEALRGSPADQSGEMCVRVKVAERRVPMRFCNRYVGGGGPGSAGAPMVSDLVEAVGLLDAYRLGPLTIERVSVRLSLRRSLRHAYMLRATGPRTARRGSTITVRVSGRIPRGGRVTRRLRVRVPRDLGRGLRELVLTGTPADRGGDVEELGEVLELTLGGDEEPEDDPGPRSVSELARGFAKLGRFDGVRASFRSDSGRTPARQVHEDRELRLSGTARLTLLVR